MKNTYLYQRTTMPGNLLAIIGLSLLIGLTGCEQQGSTGKTSGNPGSTASQNTAPSAEKPGQQTQGTTTQSIATEARNAGDYIDDSMITAKVKAAIMNDPQLRAADIQVNTEKGVVKLSGSVESEENLDKLKILANNQPGVKSVQSNLTVKAMSGKK